MKGPSGELRDREEPSVGGGIEEKVIAVTVL